MKMMFDFVQTACVLVVLSYVLSRFNILKEAKGSAKLSTTKLILVSALFIFIAIYGITFKGNMASGLYVDTRIAGISLAGFLFGGIPAAIVTSASILVTVLQHMGTEMADIVAMALAGVITSYCHDKFPNLDAALLGSIVGLIEIVHMLLIVFMIRPLDVAKTTVYAIGFPMIVVNGLAAWVFILIMKDVYDRKRLWEEENFSKSQMAVARDIQMSLLNKNFKIDPRLDLHVFLEPALDVGGDLYSYVIDDDRYFKFIIGDVSGKGISAAIMMSRCITLFQELVRKDLSPSEITSELNIRLCENNETQMFVTAMIGYLDLETGNLSYANAGHLTPFVAEDGKESDGKPRPKGVPLGVFEGCPYGEAEITLDEEQYIVFYTDGITEAENISHELYGEDRMQKALSFIEKPNAKKTTDILIADVKSHTLEAKQSDDIAVFCFGLNKRTLNFDIANDIAALAEVTTSLDNQLREKGLQEELRHNISVVIEEVVSNTIKYGYKDGRKGSISITVKATDNPPTIEIKDDSDAFDCLSIEPDTLKKPLEERPVGGMGIQMAQNRIESHTYASNDGINTTTMIVRSKEVQA